MSGATVEPRTKAGRDLVRGIMRHVSVLGPAAVTVYHADIARDIRAVEFQAGRLSLETLGIDATTAEMLDLLAERGITTAAQARSFVEARRPLEDEVVVRPDPDAPDEAIAALAEAISRSPFYQPASAEAMAAGYLSHLPAGWSLTRRDGATVAVGVEEGWPDHEHFWSNKRQDGRRECLWCPAIHPDDVHEPPEAPDDPDA